MTRNKNLTPQEIRIKTDKFMQLQEAYDLIKDTESRDLYLHTNDSERHFHFTNNPKYKQKQYSPRQGYGQYDFDPGENKKLKVKNVGKYWMLGMVFFGSLYYLEMSTTRKQKIRQKLIAHQASIKRNEA
jgi:curved DNA-binding protein CbpA